MAVSVNNLSSKMSLTCLFSIKIGVFGIVKSNRFICSLTIPVSLSILCDATIYWNFVCEVFAIGEMIFATAISGIKLCVVLLISWIDKAFGSTETIKKWGFLNCWCKIDITPRNGMQSLKKHHEYHDIAPVQPDKHNLYMEIVIFPHRLIAFQGHSHANSPF